MRTRAKLLGLVGAILLVNRAASYGATVSGTVKGPDGGPFEGAFVQAQNAKTKITYMALSDKHVATIVWKKFRPVIIKCESKRSVLLVIPRAASLLRRIKMRLTISRCKRGLCSGTRFRFIRRMKTGPRRQRQRHHFHSMFHLPWISNSHGYRETRFGRLERPRAVHA